MRKGGEGRRKRRGGNERWMECPPNERKEEVVIVIPSLPAPRLIVLHALESVLRTCKPKYRRGAGSVSVGRNDALSSPPTHRTLTPHSPRRGSGAWLAWRCGIDVRRCC